MKICWTGNGVVGVIMLTSVPLGPSSDHLYERRTAIRKEYQAASYWMILFRSCVPEKLNVNQILVTSYRDQEGADKLQDVDGGKTST